MVTNIKLKTMAGGKETPRQKMIGMMYLVLTALLALNVSKEIVNAFVKLDNKLMEGNRILIDKSESIMQGFDEARLTESLAKVPESQSAVLNWKKRAVEIRKKVFEMDHFIQMECKNKMLFEIEQEDYVVPDEENFRFKTRNLMEVQNKDDYDIATRLFGGEIGTSGYAFGAEIRNKIHAFRDELMVLVSEYEYGGKKYKIDPTAISDSLSLEEELRKNVYPEDQDRIRGIYKTLSLPEKIKDFESEVDWQLGMFDHAPVVAASALFTSLSNDIRSAEVQALEILSSRVKVEPFKVNKIEPMAFAPSNYMNLGDSMQVKIMIAAYDSTKISEVKFGMNDSVNLNQMANGTISVRANTAGKHTLFGQIAIEERGIKKWKPWSYSYEVGQPSGVVSNEDMTIIYAGYDHTFSASVSGYPQDKTMLSLNGASVSAQGGGKYTIRAPASAVGQRLNSVISVRTEQGVKSFNGPTYMVRKLPTPQVFFGSIPSTQGTVSKSEVSGNMNVGIRLGYDNSFPLNPSKVSFTITSFDMVITAGNNIINRHSDAAGLTTEMKSFLSRAGSGSTVIFKNINARGPSGAIRVPPMGFEVR